MLLVDLPARMTCDIDGCTETQPAELALTAAGTFIFRVKDTAWQVTVAKNAPMAPFGSRCPAHRQRLVEAPPELIRQIGPRGPQTVRRHGH